MQVDAVYYNVSRRAARSGTWNGGTGQARARARPPARVARSWPVAASETLRVLSSLAETMKEPSGLMGQAMTPRVWPARVRMRAGDWRRGVFSRSHGAAPGALLRASSPQLLGEALLCWVQPPGCWVKEVVGQVRIAC